MSEKWRGLHNPEWHHDNGAGYTWCSACEYRYELGCFSADPCHCCLAAEVAVLRGQIRQSQREDITALKFGLETARGAQATISRLTAEVDALILRAEKAEALLRKARDLAHEEATQATDWDDDTEARIALGKEFVALLGEVTA